MIVFRLMTTKQIKINDFSYFVFVIVVENSVVPIFLSRKRKILYMCGIFPVSGP
jgi:hypothetical protein